MNFQQNISLRDFTDLEGKMLIWELDTFACIDDVMLYFDPFACMS